MKINQILLIATILVLLILVSLEVILHETTKNNFINQRLDSSKSLSDFYTSEITNPLYFGDLKSLKKVTNNMIQNPQITSVYVLTSKGNVITDGTDSNLLYSQHLTLSSCPITESTQRTIQITDGYICVLTPIALSGHIGFLLIHFSLDDINLIIEEEILSVFLSIGSISILLIIMNAIAKKFIINPILQLNQTTKEIAKGNLEEKIEFSGSDEIRELAKDVNSMQKSINQAQKDLVKNERFLAIGELSSRLSHDIRNPLSVIQLAVDLWKKNHKEMTEKELKSIDMISNANTKIKYLIENVLNFVRSREPRYEKSSLQKILQNVKRSIHTSKNIKLFLPTDDIIVSCDPDHIEVVLENLILNSSQAIGEDSGSITVTFHEENEYVLILIQDSGGGIPENIISKIFDPLFTTKRGGTGLGLASCKSIIESHNGTLTAKNNPTTFRIKLPKNNLKGIN